MNSSPGKYPRTPYLDISPSGAADRPTTPIANFAGRPIVITEKLDGSNVLLHNGSARPRSTTAQGRAPWLAMVRKHTAWRTIALPDLHLYGEDIYGVHSIRYEPMPENRTFYLFAARRGPNWLSWLQVQQHARNISATTVPVLFNGRIDDPRQLAQTVRELAASPSAIGPQREGIVIRVADAFTDAEFHHSVAKYVRPNHVQPDEQHWSTRWHPCPTTEPTYPETP